MPEHTVVNFIRTRSYIFRIINSCCKFRHRKKIVVWFCIVTVKMDGLPFLLLFYLPKFCWTVRWIRDLAKVSAKQSTMSVLVAMYLPSLVNMLILLDFSLMFRSFSYIFAGGVFTFVHSKHCCISWRFVCLNVLVAIARALFQLILSSTLPLVFHFMYSFFSLRLEGAKN